MKINYKFIQILIALGSFLFLWRILIGNYFYTKSEKKIIELGRGEGKFTFTDVMVTFSQILGFALVLYFIVPNST